MILLQRPCCFAILCKVTHNACLHPIHSQYVSTTKGELVNNIVVLLPCTSDEQSVFVCDSAVSIEALHAACHTVTLLHYCNVYGSLSV